MSKKKSNHHVTSTKLTRLMVCEACCGDGEIRMADAPALRRAREKSGVTLRAMAKRVKVSAPFISDVELGRRGCPDYILKAYQKL